MFLPYLTGHNCKKLRYSGFAELWQKLFDIPYAL